MRGSVSEIILEDRGYAVDLRTHYQTRVCSSSRRRNLVPLDVLAQGKGDFDWPVTADTTCNKEPDSHAVPLSRTAHTVHIKHSTMSPSTSGISYHISPWRPVFVRAAC